METTKPEGQAMTKQERIEKLLIMALDRDLEAMAIRRAVGHLLAELRYENGDGFQQVLDDCGLDQRTADLLIAVAAGGTVRA